MKGLQLILKEAVKSTMFGLTFPKAKVLNVTLMNNRIYVHHPQNETCLIAVTKTNIDKANFKFKGVIDTKILCDLTPAKKVFREHKVDPDYISLDECKGFGIHLEQCDNDGFCNHCGNQ